MSVPKFAETRIKIHIAQSLAIVASKRGGEKMRDKYGTHR